MSQPKSRPRPAPAPRAPTPTASEDDIGAACFEPLRARMFPSGQGFEAQHQGLTLYSHFQPIYSLAHRRPVGHEALLRARTGEGLSIPPLEVLARCQTFNQTLELDRLCRLLHVSNYAMEQGRESHSKHWLFVNMHPEVFLRAPRLGGDAFARQVVEHCRFPMHRLVIEVLEEAVRDDADFGAAVSYFRNLGCLIALDDFGAGHSNFDRVWRIRPEIVKLDRSLTLKAAGDRNIRRILGQMVALLHENGALVLLEGVETEEEAYMALEADADFVQGYHFGRPASLPLAAAQPASTLPSREIQQVWTNFDRRWQGDRSAQQQLLAPYLHALGNASVLLSVGKPLEEACAEFLQLDNALFGYLLDAHGQQIGTNVWARNHAPQCDPRFAPLAEARGSRWSRRPYFRRAVENFGRVQITRPYLSVSSAQLCITLSIAFHIDHEVHVVCGDVSARESAREP